VEPHFPARAKRVILIFTQGGLSHVDTFDHKPLLNERHGRPFRDGENAKILGSPWAFRQHGESGQWISEVFPHLARHADDLCFITTMHTDQQAHQTAVPMFHTGAPLQVRPSLGAWSLYGLGSESDDLPGFIAMNPLRNIGGQNHGSAFLPAEFQATMVRPGGKGDGEPLPNITPAHVTSAQQTMQLGLLRRINGERLERDLVNPELEDLKQRGMLKDTLVIFAGEFGRTPFAQFDNGRDHNNRAFTIWMAGGGVRAGHRHGVTDEFGSEGLEGRVHIHDLHATILHLLGLDHERLTYRYSGRDFRLTDVHGEVVEGILA
jgi:hypothetical protein